MKEIVARHKKWLLPVAVIAVTYGIATVIRLSGPEVEIISPEPQAVVVRVVTAAPEAVQALAKKWFHGPLSATAMGRIADPNPWPEEWVA